jgi:hypothetical protein
LPIRIARHLSWTPLYFLGAIAMGLLVSHFGDQTMYGGMRAIRWGFACAAAVAVLAAVLTALNWRQLPVSSRVCGLAPFALVLMFVCFAIAHDHLTIGSSDSPV